MFAKMIEGMIQFAPFVLSGDGVNVWNPPAEMYLAQGWKPVVFTDEPEAPSGYYYESGWEEQTDTIVQTWMLVELPDDIDETEAYDIIFGEIE